MLPVFGELRRHFGLGPHSADTSKVVTFFFWGQVAQLLFGTLSDRYGRLAILRIGFPLYIAGGIVAAFAPSLSILFAARFVAGMGASAVFMTTIAGVRDRFSGDAMARTLSFILTIFLFTPVVAPFLGLVILSVASWQAVFLTPPAFAVVVALWSFRLEESLPPERRSVIHPGAVLRAIGHALRNTTFLRYTTLTTILFTGISTYVASSEHIISDLYGQPGLFAIIFGAIGLTMALGALSNAAISARFGTRRAIKGLLIIYVVVAMVLLAGSLLFRPQPPLPFFFTCIGLLMGANLAIEPNSSALAMEPMGDMAGIAASLYGTCFFFVGASLGSIISALLAHSVMPMVIGFAGIGLIALSLVLTDRHKAL